MPFLNSSVNTFNSLRSGFCKSVESGFTSEEKDNCFFMMLEHEFNLSKEQFYVNPDLKLSESDLLIVHRIIRKLNSGIPIQYILGWTDFDGLRLKVDHRVLIPRPETEELVNLITTHELNRPARILDVGTGSGCIALALKKKFPEAIVSAIDESMGAIEVASFNAKNTGFEIDLIRRNVLIKDWTIGLHHTEIVVSNPPYILEQEKNVLQKQVIDNEPHIALFAPNEQPLIFFEQIGIGSLEVLSDKGRLYFECHENHAKEVAEMLQKMGYSSVEVYVDFRGKNRFVRAVKN
jgi:release factor glutamine methyltransferase